MYRFIETIKIQHGLPCKLPLHEDRLQRTRQHFFPDAPPAPALANWLQVPAHCKTGIYKCRVIYARDLLHAEFLPYTPRPIHRLKLVADDSVDYAWKCENRSALERLYAQKSDCDEVLIVKNGFLTDSSYSNLAFYDGKAWYTPEMPLLQGIQREWLLREEQIISTPIRIEDLNCFSQIALINAMLDLGDCVVDVANVFGR
ncbi:MAG: aminotransferase class IV [Saprospiraceae bacterium]|nr:aminotransferase class IV [Saprospiraceae bacterium]